MTDRIRRGATRQVILTRTFAIKVPAIWSWRTFLWGLLANMQERAFWSARWDELAPVLFSDPLGFVLVMPRARVMTTDEFSHFDYEGFTRRSDGSVVPAEEKADSFGWLQGRVVAIDYGS